MGDDDEWPDPGDKPLRPGTPRLPALVSTPPAPRFSESAAHESLIRRIIERVPQLAGVSEAIARLFDDTDRRDARRVGAYAACLLYFELSKLCGEKEAKRVFAGLGKPRSKKLSQDARKMRLRRLYDCYVVPLDLDLQRAAKDLVEHAPDIYGRDGHAVDRIRKQFGEFQKARGRKGKRGRPVNQ